MNIVYTEVQEVPLDCIKAGECFIWSEAVFMKITSYEGINDFNAVELETGNIMHLSEDETVIPVYAEVYVTETRGDKIK